jgi:hypothetical protein
LFLHFDGDIGEGVVDNVFYLGKGGLLDGMGDLSVDVRFASRQDHLPCGSQLEFVVGRRAGRARRSVISLADPLAALFYTWQQQMGTSEKVLTLLGAWQTSSTTSICERVRAGIRSARAKSKKRGRP